MGNYRRVYPDERTCPTTRGSSGVREGLRWRATEGEMVVVTQILSLR